MQFEHLIIASLSHRVALILPFLFPPPIAKIRDAGLTIISGLRLSSLSTLKAIHSEHSYLLLHRLLQVDLLVDLYDLYHRVLAFLLG